MDAICQCIFHYIVRPKGGLYLADMSFSEIIHTDTGLSNASAYRIGQFAVQQRFLEGQVGPFFASGLLQLAPERIFINADTHGRNFESHIQNRIIYNDITI